MPELWLNPLVGQPPALWYSAVAQMTTSTTMARVPTVVLIQKRRLRSICAIACWRASCPVAGASAPLSPGLSWEMSCNILTPSFDWEPSILLGAHLAPLRAG